MEKKGIKFTDPPDRSADDPRKGYEIWERYRGAHARCRVPSVGIVANCYYFPHNLACFFLKPELAFSGSARVRFCVQSNENPLVFKSFAWVNYYVNRSRTHFKCRAYPGPVRSFTDILVH